MAFWPGFRADISKGSILFIVLKLFPDSIASTGKPEIYSLYKVLQVFGLTLSVSPKKHTPLKKAA